MSSPMELALETCIRPSASSVVRSSMRAMMPGRASRSMMGWPSASSSTTESRYSSSSVSSVQVPRKRLTTAVLFVPGSFALTL